MEQAANYMVHSILQMLLVLVGIVALFWCIRVLCLRFQKKPREAKADTDNPLSPTLQWMNTAGSILLASNKGDFHYLAGCYYPGREKEPGGLDSTRRILQSFWSIHDHDTALETMTRLVHSGMREGYGRMMRHLEIQYPNYTEEQLIEVARQENPKANEDSFLPKMVMAYRRYGENALLGWDMGRAAYITQRCYMAGYLSMEEMMNLCVQAGQYAQAFFQNWEEMMESYLLGGQYWKDEDANDPDSMTAKRWKIYETLWRGEKPYETIPYVSVPFDLPLSKKIITDRYGRVC